MLNNKYDNIALVPISAFILLGVIWLSLKVYNVILETSAEGIISSLKTSYNSQVNNEGALNISDTIEGYNKSVLEAYERSTQGSLRKYEIIENTLKLSTKIGDNTYPRNFNEFIREELIPLESFENIKSSIVLDKRQIEISGKINKITNAKYKFSGTWAIYFNDKLQYSSNFFITDDATESIGTHFFKYKFSEDKDVYLRIIYKVKNVEKDLDEFLYHEEILSIRK